MVAFQDYRRHDALALAELVRTKQVTPQELLDAALARSRDVSGKLNAIVVDHEAQARKSIRDGLPKGPLAGVPYLLKDLGAALKGTITTGSLSLTKDTVAEADSTFVERCKAAGLVIFGKTHSPELGLSPSSESRMHGATRNPWNLNHIAGGSSGGAAAAVSAVSCPSRTPRMAAAQFASQLPAAACSA